MTVSCMNVRWICCVWVSIFIWVFYVRLSRQTMWSMWWVKVSSFVFFASYVSTAAEANAQRQGGQPYGVLLAVHRDMPQPEYCTLFDVLHTHNTVIWEVVSRIKGRVRLGSKRSRTHKKAFFSLWKWVCRGIIGSRHSDAVPLGLCTNVELR